MIKSDLDTSDVQEANVAKSWGLQFLYAVAAVIIIVWLSLEIVERIGYSFGLANCTC
jgi:hypothetical protein